MSKRCIILSHLLRVLAYVIEVGEEQNVRKDLYIMELFYRIMRYNANRYGGENFVKMNYVQKIVRIMDLVIMVLVWYTFVDITSVIWEEPVNFVKKLFAKMNAHTMEDVLQKVAYAIKNGKVMNANLEW